MGVVTIAHVGTLAALAALAAGGTLTVGPTTASLVTLGSPSRLSGGYLYHRRMADAAHDHGFEVRFESYPERAFPLPALATPRLLPALAADVVVVDSIAAAYLAPWRRRLPRPVVAVLHQPPGGMEGPPVRRRAQAVLDRALYRRADVLVAASEALGAEVASQVATEVRVVPPGCDPPRRGGAAGLQADGRVALLCVGNWVPRKGVLELVEAFATLPDGTAVLHLVGRTDADPRYARRVRARLARADLARSVVVHGPVAPDRMGALYEAADVFVLPSTVEPYGTVYGEALASGLPVVGWRAGNLPHLADHGREGLLVEPGDVGGLAAALRVVATDAAVRARLAAAARARGATLPTWEESAAAFFAVLREAVGGARSRR